MSATSRELVYQTLAFNNLARAPRDLWTLPWATNRYPKELERLRAEFPMDIARPVIAYREPLYSEGDFFTPGHARDPWGCIFTIIHEGLAGEVKEPLIFDWDTDIPNVHFPYELLSIDVDDINRQCAASDCFMLAEWLVHPFEQLQFIRGTSVLFMDLLEPSPVMRGFMDDMHALNCRIFEAWAKTDVDALMFFDDWGSQKSLLINPELWRTYFKPMYQDYIQIAHGADKKCFMHSDGNILAILPDLVELRLDAINAQLFCMDFNELAKFAGRTTFWGEIDRQHILAEGSREDVAHAVEQVHSHLWKHGGCIAHCEFGARAKPENVQQVYASWNELTM